MKRIHQLPALLLFLCLGIHSSFNLLQAQSASASNFEAAIVADFCDSFTKGAPGISKENMTVEMGMMIVPLLSKYSQQIKSEWGFEISNKEDLRKTGERIGQVAALKCPAFLEFIKSNLSEFSQQNESETSKTYTGKLLKIEGAPFAYLLVQNKQGRTDKIYWMEFFEGADKLTSQPVVYLNKPVTVTYKEVEVYQAVDKEYKTIKVATKLVW